MQALPAYFVLYFIGMILNETVDFAVSIFGIKDSRMKVVDYMVTSSSPERGYVYIKNPEETFDWDVYGQPFWKNTWIFITIYSIIIPVLIMIILGRRK